MPRPTPTDREWESFVIAFGHNLNRLRVERGLSQEIVAARAGVSRYTYQRLERARATQGAVANPSMRNVIAIAQAMGVSLDELMPAPLPDLGAR